MAWMTVYHGGCQAVDKARNTSNRYTKDFGTGFYCTIIKEQDRDGQNATIQKSYQYMM